MIPHAKCRRLRHLLAQRRSISTDAKVARGVAITSCGTFSELKKAPHAELHSRTSRASSLRMSTSTPTSHRTGISLRLRGFVPCNRRRYLIGAAASRSACFARIFATPHRPSDRELRLTDLYARQPADVIASGISEQRLRGSEARLQAAVDELRSLNETLEERVRARTAETEEANQKLRSEIAERVRAEQRLQELQSALFHASRLSAMGQMAGSLAHELNRPWAPPPILSMQRPAFSRAANTPRLDIASRMIEDAAGQMHRAGQTIRRLRDFVSHGETEKRAENVVTIIEAASPMALVGPAALGVEMG